MADIRSCQQCAGMFVPRREHARFCSVGCRVEWNRDHMGDPTVEVSALQWSITAMSETVGRLGSVSSVVRPRALAVIGEAVWWVTIVDATLVRHHLLAHESVLTSQGAAGRQVTEGTLAGLRFVRNQLGHKVDLTELAAPAAPAHRAADWTWRPVPEPALASSPLRARSWELTRYRAYQAWLAGHPVGETFGRAREFLRLAGADALSAASADVQPVRLPMPPGQPAGGHAYLSPIGLPARLAGFPPGGGTSSRSTQTPPCAA